MPDNSRTLSGTVLLGVGTLLAWLGLAGLSDSVVVWRDWFEIGVMTHWRAVKDWLLECAPFAIPFWVPDFLLVLGTMIRALNIGIVKLGLHEKHPLLADRGQRPVDKYPVLVRFIIGFIACILLLPIIFALSVLLFLMFSPAIVLALIAAHFLFVRSIIDQEWDLHGVTRAIVFQFWGAILSFIPILFILTNELPKISAILGF